MVVLDFGGLKDGYGSDTTRTVHVGEPTDEERAVYEVVRRAQQAGVDAVRPGVACQEIDRAAGASSPRPATASSSSTAPATASALTTHEPPYMVEGETQPLSRACASRSNPASTWPAGSASASRTSSPSPRTAGGALNRTTHELQIVA